MSEENALKVQKLRSGTVIDHITAEKGLLIAKILNLTAVNGSTLLVGTNLPSKKYDKKDIIKMEDRTLNQEEKSKIALICPQATLTTVKDYNVVDKTKLTVPDTVKNLITCPNPKCITQLEPKNKFIVENKHPVVVRCHYCERSLKGQDIGDNIIIK